MFCADAGAARGEFRAVPETGPPSEIEILCCTWTSLTGAGADDDGNGSK